MPGRLITLRPSVSKSDLLLWDQIAVIGLERKWAGLPAATRADLQYLVDARVVHALPGTEAELVRWAAANSVEVPRGTLGSTLTFKSRLSEQDGRVFTDLPRDDQILLGRGYERLIARLESSCGLDSVALVHDQPLGDQPVVTWDERYAGSVLSVGVVWEVVLRELPTVADHVPLESILEFRADRETTALALRLRRWMSNVAADERSAADVRAEIRDLRSEYAAHMRRHRLEHGSTALMALVTGIPDAIGNAVRLKFGPAVKSLFAIRERRVKLFDAEQAAPGREVAYLEHAAKHFGA